MKFILHLILLALSLCALSVQAQPIELPNMGESSGAVISPEMERRIGENMLRQIRRSVFFVDDPEVNAYIDSLGYKLVAQSDDRTHPFTFFMLHAPTINAFAAPGGYIGLHSGLVTSTESESELASVIAHEISHVTQKHLARSFETFSKFSLPTIAALLASIVIATQNPQAGTAALAATQATSAQAQLNFTRSNEQEADRIGIKLLAKAGFDPYAMPVFFERLQKESRYYSNLPPEFLRTHPVNVSRIADSRNRAEQYPYKQVTDSLAYHLVRAKLQVLESKNPQRMVKRLKSSLMSGQYRHEDATRYGYALALMRTNAFKLAQEQTNILLKRNPDVVAYRLLQARIELAAGHAAKAIELYAKLLKKSPGNHPVIVYYAKALIQSGNAGKAVKLLQKHMRHRAPDPSMFQLLAQAQNDAGFPSASHQSMAEHYYYNGQTMAAIGQLRIALKTKGTDFYTNAKIESRLKQLQFELAEEEAR